MSNLMFFGLNTHGEVRIAVAPQKTGFPKSKKVPNGSNANYYATLSGNHNGRHSTTNNSKNSSKN